VNKIQHYTLPCLFHLRFQDRVYTLHACFPARLFLGFLMRKQLGSLLDHSYAQWDIKMQLGGTVQNEYSILRYAILYAMHTHYSSSALCAHDLLVSRSTDF
jgi:hypothetical protein